MLRTHRVLRQAHAERLSMQARLDEQGPAARFSFKKEQGHIGMMVVQAAEPHPKDDGKVMIPDDFLDDLEDRVYVAVMRIALEGGYLQRVEAHLMPQVLEGRRYAEKLESQLRVGINAMAMMQVQHRVFVAMEAASLVLARRVHTVVPQEGVRLTAMELGLEPVPEVF